MSDSSARQVAVVASLRTPFVRQGTVFGTQTARGLGALVVRELVQTHGIAREHIRRVVFGQVIGSPEAPNIAREVVLGAGLDSNVDAHSVSRACTTSYQATADLLRAIQCGEVDAGIAGGADCASDLPFTLSKPLARALLRASKAHSWSARLRVFRGLRGRDLLPRPPALREPSSELTMGQSAEKMAKENAIARAEQDAFAHRSHRNAGHAWDAGWLDEQVMPVRLEPDFMPVRQDNLYRANSDLNAYAGLKPVFDKRHGSVTAGNSSPLTDGAAALLLMRLDLARSLGLPVLGLIRSVGFAALDPAGQMLMGPAFATPKALDAAGMSLADLDLVDMHEAFAAQVISNLQAFGSHRFAREKLGRDQPIGEIDPDRLNVNGGSIAIGHPFAATGARQIGQLLHDLHRRGGGVGLCTACAAGGLGAAMVLETL